MEYIRIRGDKNKAQVKEIMDKYSYNPKTGEKDCEETFDFLFNINENRFYDGIDFYDSLAKLIQEIIIDIYLKETINKKIREKFLDFTFSKKEEIKKKVYEISRNKDVYKEERFEININLANYLIKK